MADDSTPDAMPDPALPRTEIPEELPGMRLASTVVFPFDVVSVQVDRPRSRRMIDAHPGDAQIVGTFLPIEPEKEPASTKAQFHPVGVACRVIHRMQMPNDTVQIVLQGLQRIRLVEVAESDPFLRFGVAPVDESEPRGASVDARIVRLMDMVDELVQSEGGYPAEMVNILRMNIAGAGRFADLVGAHLNLPLPIKRHLVAAGDVKERLRIVEDVLGEALGRLEVRKEVGDKVRADLSERQRHQLLRAELKAIHEELGMASSAEAEVEALRGQIEAKGLPDDAAQAATRELERLTAMQPASGEYQVVRTYLQWLIDLPWAAEMPPGIDLRKARRVLDRDHHGLDEVKARILEVLAVQRLRDEPRGPVLCLSGPPGVGKTSLGRSIAEAMGRPFVRFSVGGVRDEAEIRGHRRTYVGAMPGKIIQSLKRAGATHPLLLIDEIDKMGSDARGDPSSAMLEVLDPSQNDGFVDHYLDVPYDLSRTFFVCTANDLSAIPGPLRDRMEIVRLSGYTRLEKLQIARRHLLPQVLEECGLTSRRLIFTDEGLLALIDGYTREAGVRDLKRQIGRVGRHHALHVASAAKSKPKRLRADAKAVARILGPRSFQATVRSGEAAVGVTAGLAWTPVGGDLLFVEGVLVPGKGAVKITGQLGDVMRESAQAALTYVKSIAAELGIAAERFAAFDVHLHVPDGATPKDGPSAGVTLAACLASLYTGRPARADVAMTGEITLKGRVLPVGGIKEKVLAAHRAGIEQVLLPEGNRKDWAQIPEDVRAQLLVRFTKEARENIDAALLPFFLADGTGVLTEGHGLRAEPSDDPPGEAPEPPRARP